MPMVTYTICLLHQKKGNHWWVRASSEQAEGMVKLTLPQVPKELVGNLLSEMGVIPIVEKFCC